MFHSILQSWNNVCSDSANVKVSTYFYCPFKFLMNRHNFVVCGSEILQELIPELFYLPEMLTNHNKVSSNTLFPCFRTHQIFAKEPEST